MLILNNMVKLLLLRFFRYLISFIIIVAALLLYIVATWDLPPIDHLKSYEPPLVTRFYSADHKLFAEYATEKRIFMPIHKIPPKVIQTFLAVEDKNFFQHKGVDYNGILRAIVKNIQNYFRSDHVLMGGSTITQQVAKNFLLSSEQTFSRKIKEVILAFKLEKEYSKEKILELYLNDIYLGGGTYGIASAAHYYFSKSLDELNNEEIAYLAILPKAPNTYNFYQNPKAALKRRNWALIRMVEERVISATDGYKAQNHPLKVTLRRIEEVIHADYFSEMLRKEILKNYGRDILYKGGLSIQTTLDSRLQKIARSALLKGLVRQDRLLGWRGPLAQISLKNWEEGLHKISPPKGLKPYKIAVVLDLDSEETVWIGLPDGRKGIIPLQNLAWAYPRHKKRDHHSASDPLSKPHDILSPGDVIVVSSDSRQSSFNIPSYRLEQIPEVNGAIVVINPHNGHILALEGGYSFEKSEFNRATQAFRQPGSTFKPFVYLAALEQGYTPNSLLLDTEVEINIGNGKVWRPHNINKKSYGVVPLKVALEKSMNLATLWLTQRISTQHIELIAQKFGIVKNLPPEIVVALGTVETSLLKLTNAYACLVNHGYKIIPQWILSIKDRRGNILYEAPTIPEKIPLVSENSAYQMIKMLESSVEKGAAKKAYIDGYSIGGKTGTSQDYFDAWFIGFSPDLVVGVMVGFDQPKSLGKSQTGSAVAIPIFKDFMTQALLNTPPKSFLPPSSVRTAWVDQVIDGVNQTELTNTASSLDKSDEFERIIPKSIMLEKY